jgi:hypothetical protein
MKKLTLIIIAGLGIFSCSAFGQSRFPENPMANKLSAPTPLTGTEYVTIEQGKQRKAAQVTSINQATGALFTTAVPAINAKTAAATTLLTVPTGRKFYVTGIKFETTTGTAVSGGAIITVGSTGTAANSIVASQTLSSSAITTSLESGTLVALNKVIAAGDVIQFTVATGATATTQTLTVHLTGFYNP